MKTKSLFLLFIIALSVFLTGCVGFRSKSMPQKHYLLTVESPYFGASAISNIKSNFKEATLEVYPPQITSQFAGTSFVYRTSEINYLSDYYNVFFGFPAEQIQQNSIKYIQANKIFKYISDNPYPLKADYALKTNITELYADYRNPKIPTAVITIQYILFNTREKPKIIFNKTFSEKIALTEKSSNALVNAWNQGLQKIFKQLVQKLGTQKNLH